MTHQELIDSIANERRGVTKVAVKAVLAELAVQVSAELCRNGQMTIKDIGTFKVLETAERQGRNPNTGDSITIAAGKRVKFKAAKGLKEAL